LVFGVGLIALAGCTGRVPAAHTAQGRHSATNRRIAAHTLATGQERLAYSVRMDDLLSRIEVEVCPTGFRIERLEAPSPGAQTLLAEGKIVTPEGDYPCPDEGVDLPGSKPDACLSYAVDLRKIATDPLGLRRVGRDLLASPDSWLWVPTPRPAGLPMRVHFTLPKGLVAAMPWPALPTSATPASAPTAPVASATDFTLSETAFAWKAGGAFTHTAPVAIPVPGGELEWTALDAGFGEHTAAISAWLSEGAQASSLLFGHFPVSHALVIAVPGERVRSFGMALRGGGPAVVLLLDSGVTTDRLASDWTCTHEFLHLGVPRLPPEDSWLFEGLATYYTEVVRARAGLISPALAYQHLLDGFERGRRNGGLRTLRQESAEMRENHAFYRVYWAGAALAFLTDIAARRAGGTTLDSALRSFAECCAASEEDWDAERVLAHLDASLGTPRFATLAHTWLDRAAFPELGDALRDLGVLPGTPNGARLVRAPHEALRDAIMARASQPRADGEPHER
jgi:hypothetical protein